VPTTNPRYVFTDSGRVRELLDDAARRWPDISQRKALLLRLAEEGHSVLEQREEELRGEERWARTRRALARIPSLVDRDLLLSDAAWS
jgi:hypothetical protein